MKNNILIIGPFSPPITGVSVANDLLYVELAKNSWWVDRINTEFNNSISASHGTLNLRKFEIIKSYFKGIKIFRSKIVYITIGQTFFGVVKYAPFIFLATFLKKKIVVHLHGNHLLNEYNELKGVKRHIFSAILKRTSYGIVLSKSLRKNFDPFLPQERIFELFNFFEKNISVSEEEFLDKKNYKHINLLFLSNILEEKGINVFFEAIREINKRGILINVKIAGNKVANNNIDNYLKELTFIEYCGVVKELKKKELLLWSNVFCLPTFYKMEGQPISIIEAMATGNLILTTKHAGITDICSEENAVFCKKNDVDDLVNQILFLSNNIKQIETIGKYNYKQANVLFTQDKFVDEADNILQRCMN